MESQASLADFSVWELEQQKLSDYQTCRCYPDFELPKDDIKCSILENPHIKFSVDPTE